MPTPTNCYPWWHATYSQIAAQPWSKTIIPGCGSAGSDGNVPCSPATLRANAEAWLIKNAPQALVMMGGTVTQDAYTFARYMHSEVGNGTLEERVAVGEAAVGRARRSKRTIAQLLTPSGHYGPIHAASEAVCLSMGYQRGVTYNGVVPNRCSETAKPGICCSPYKRWASTSRDPSVLSLLLAHLVVSGGSGNFANGADDQAGPENWISYGQTSLDNYIKRLAASGKFWVGPLPGVDHWRTYLTFTPDTLARAALGPQLLARGLEAVKLPAVHPVWPSTMPVCSKGATAGGGSFSGADVALALLGLAAGTAGAIYFNRWLAAGEHV